MKLDVYLLSGWAGFGKNPIKGSGEIVFSEGKPYCEEYSELISNGYMSLSFTRNMWILLPSLLVRPDRTSGDGTQCGASLRLGFSLEFLTLRLVHTNSLATF